MKWIVRYRNGTSTKVLLERSRRTPCAPSSLIVLSVCASPPSPHTSPSTDDVVFAHVPIDRLQLLPVLDSEISPPCEHLISAGQGDPSSLVGRLVLTSNLDISPPAGRLNARLATSTPAWPRPKRLHPRCQIAAHLSPTQAGGFFTTGRDGSVPSGQIIGNTCILPDEMACLPLARCTHAARRVSFR